jgi:hypothetical protein
MKTKDLKETKLTLVKNIDGCTNFGGVELVGNKMYTIKTRSDNALSYISVYPDYRKKSRTNHRFDNCMGHGNDICYADGKLYVAPCGLYTEVVDISNWSHFRLACDLGIFAIAHVSGNQFIALTGGNGATYNLAILEPRDGKMNVIKMWTVNNPKACNGYTISQGMGFKKSKNKIYMVFSKTDLKRNVILRSSIGSADPDYCFRSNKSPNKYEFEGCTFNNAGKMIIGMNLPNGGDAIVLGNN